MMTTGWAVGRSCFRTTRQGPLKVSVCPITASGGVPAWSWEWVEQSDARSTLRLWHSGTCTPTACEKWVTLDIDEPRLRIRYRIENTGSKRLHFLFKQHLAVAVTPTSRIELPGGTVTPVDLSFSRRLGHAGPFVWPQGRDRFGNNVDLSELPPLGEGLQEFVYVSDLPGGWCGVRDQQSGARIRLHFQRDVFPYTWLFMTFGGWRGHYVVVLEPCTNLPKDLTAALESGRCAVLEPGEVLDTEVIAEIS